MEHGIEVLSCPPIAMLDHDELFPKDKARRLLGVPKDAICVYVQLGAGEINNIESEIRLTVEALIENQRHVVLGESLIGERIDIDLPRVHILRDYPNRFISMVLTQQFRGYNSFQ